MALLVGIASIPAAAIVFTMVAIELAQGMEAAGVSKRKRR